MKNIRSVSTTPVSLGMEHGSSLNDTSETLRPSLSAQVSEPERHAARERAAQARAAASDAIARYTELLAQSRVQPNVMGQRFAVIEATRDMLRESVLRYAAMMKVLEVPPERTLRLVKETLAEQVPHPEREEETRALLESVVGWCIEAYYDESPAA